MTTKTETIPEIIADDMGRALAGVSEIVKLLSRGDVAGAGLRAAELAVDLVPPELLRDKLTARGVTLANQAADALEEAKFGSP